MNVWVKSIRSEKCVTQFDPLTLSRIFIQPLRQNSNVALFTWLKLGSVENDRHLLYLPYQSSNYHPEKVLDMDLMCLIIIKKGLNKNKSNVTWLSFYAALTRTKSCSKNHFLKQLGVRSSLLMSKLFTLCFQTKCLISMFKF